MTLYRQETGPTATWVGSLLKFEAPKLTSGSAIYLFPYVHFENSVIFDNARHIIGELGNPDILLRAQALLSAIQEIANQFETMDYGFGTLPKFRAHHDEDGSVLFEWKGAEFRVGFSIELNPNDSGWYLVTTPKLGSIDATGSLMGQDLKTLLYWLHSFVFGHT